MVPLTSLKRIIISRTDNIGDVVATLPFMARIKALHPTCEIIFLGRGYVKGVLDASPHVDGFIDWEEYNCDNTPEFRQALKDVKADAIVHLFPKKAIALAAKKAKIPHRIGTSHRWYHIVACNHWAHFSRRHSTQHEAQLNMKLFAAFGLPTEFTHQDLIPGYQLQTKSPLPTPIQALLKKDKFNLIVHPGTNGSTREWSTDNFVALIKALPEDQFRIFLTGSPKEAELFKDTLIAHVPQAINLMGQFDLPQLLTFIDACDGLLAGSTGPLHMAAAIGIHTLGLFPATRTMSPNRWAPIGKKAEHLVTDQPCPGCENNNDCACIKWIRVSQVKQRITQWLPEIA